LWQRAPQDGTINLVLGVWPPVAAVELVGEQEPKKTHPEKITVRTCWDYAPEDLVRGTQCSRQNNRPIAAGQGFSLVLVPEDRKGDQRDGDDPQNHVFARILFFRHSFKYSTP
jgi:hypothetical protein